jgi:Multicopper oxidase/Transposase
MRLEGTPIALPGNSLRLASSCHDPPGAAKPDNAGATPEVIGVAIEMTQGPVVEALLERGFCVYGINPKQLDRFRDRFTVAGAKDDRRDPHVLAESLRPDRHAFRRLSNDEPVIVKLREWSRMADDLQQERTRLASRMREQLWRYYPQMLELADDLAADWFLDLWGHAPTPAKAVRLRETTIERFVKAHRLRRWQAPEVLRIRANSRNRPVARISELAEAVSPALTLDLESRLQAMKPLAQPNADRVHTLNLTGDMAKYIWSINNVAWTPDVPSLPIAKGERVELILVNQTGMPHPMHLHGHEFQVIEIDGKRFSGAVRDTVLVTPGRRVILAFDANNPGTWAFHCHLLYHSTPACSRRFGTSRLA